MTPREALADLLEYLHEGGIAELQTKGLTEEEEQKEMWNTFKEIADLGYPRIHTLRVVPSDGRPPYIVHVDSAYRS